MDHVKNVNKIIRTSIPHFWLYVAMSFVVSAVVRMLALIPAVLMKNIIDVYIPASNVTAVIQNIVLLVGVTLASGVITAWYRKSTAVNGRNTGHKLFAKCFEKILYQPMRYYDENNSAEIASYCRAEAMEYILLWIIDIPQLASSLCVGAVVFSLLVKTNAVVGILQLLYIPMLLIPCKFMADKTQGYNARIADNRAQTNQLLNDTFRGIRFVKTMLIEKLQLHKLRQVNEDTVSIWGKMVALDNAQGVWMTSLVDSLFTGVTFGLGALYVVKGDLSIGALVIILNYLPQFFSIVKEVSKINFNYKKMLGSYEKLFEMISMEDERDLPCKNVPFVFNDEISFDHITFRYNDTRGNVLTDLSLTIQKGEWVGIVGESGAGKSTLFDLLQKFYRPNAGRISVDGVDINDIETDSLRRNIISVAQDTFLFPGTLRENLQLAKPDASEQELMAAIDEVKLTALLREMPKGLDEEIGENGVQMSGGQRQRLAIAQALLHGCQLLILDEVTSNLDEKTEREIVEMLKQLKDQEGITIACISHRPNILKYADRIVTIQSGHSVE